MPRDYALKMASTPGAKPGVGNQQRQLLRRRTVQRRTVILLGSAQLLSGIGSGATVAIGSLPVIMANTVSFLFIATIVGLKLRYG